YETHPYFRTNKISWFDYFVIPFYHSGKTQLAGTFALTRHNNKFLQDVGDLAEIDGWEKIKGVGNFHRFLKDFTDDAILFFISKENFKKDRKSTRLTPV